MSVAAVLAVNPIEYDSLLLITLLLSTHKKNPATAARTVCGVLAYDVLLSILIELFFNSAC